MSQYNVAQAKTHLSELIEAALGGDEVVIARNGRPVVKLVVIDPVHKRRRAGFASDLNIVVADDFDAPLDDFSEYVP